MKQLRTFVIASSLALCGVGVAQPYRIAWSRSSSSADLTLDAVHDGILNANDQYVFAGGSKETDGSRKGNITILAPNRALVDFVDVPAPTSGGTLEFTHVRQHDGYYIAVGQAFEADSTDGKLYIGKFDANLNLVASNVIATTPAPGFEEPTDVVIDDLGRIYVALITRNGSGYTAKVSMQDFHFVIAPEPIATIDVANYSKPELTANGIIAILIGLVTDAGLTVNSYSPTGTLNFSWGAEGYGTYGYKVTFEDVLISSYCVIAGNRNVDLGGGQFGSRGDIFKINANTGAMEGLSSLPMRPGADTVIPVDSASGSASNKRVNLLFNYGGKPLVRSLDAGFTISDDFVNPQAFWPGSMFIDAYNELEVSGMRPTGTNTYRGFKLNPNNDLRFSWGLEYPTTNYLLPYMEQSNIYRSKSGDFVDILSDGQVMQLVCIQQAPVALTDGVFRPQTGKLFRPANPVVANDRNAGGAAITITQAPAHGTVTMGADGFFNYTSTAGYRGADSFKYTLTKAGLNTSTATVNLNVQ